MAWHSLQQQPQVDGRPLSNSTIGASSSSPTGIGAPPLSVAFLLQHTSGLFVAGFRNGLPQVYTSRVLLAYRYTERKQAEHDGRCFGLSIVEFRP